MEGTQLAFLLSAIEVAAGLLDVARLTPPGDRARLYRTASWDLHNHVLCVLCVIELAAEERRSVEAKLELLRERLIEENVPA
ncbi:MAG: hypothetical protein JO270_14335 [Acidobacteriaceae bacterium]|nr:hypothetical protein [Acidobacteriaceae bacterium]